MRGDWTGCGSPVHAAPITSDALTEAASECVANLVVRWPLCRTAWLRRFRDATVRLGLRGGWTGCCGPIHAAPLTSVALSGAASASVAQGGEHRRACTRKGEGGLEGQRYVPPCGARGMWPAWGWGTQPPALSRPLVGSFVGPSGPLVGGSPPEGCL